MSTTTFTRAYPLDDIKVRSGGDGRTVEAYASVFGTPAEIKDQDGHYNEVIGRSAFDKTIAERGLKFGVFYNHGLTLHGTPSERHSMPIGTPIEIRADQRGVLTVTKYNRTQLADEVLESIREGAITGQSFSGRMIQSDPKRGPYRSRNGAIPTVTRTEIAMREYGPTPLPAYEEAGIMGVRALLEAYRIGAVNLDDTDVEGSPEDEAMDAHLQDILSRLPQDELEELAEMAEAMIGEGDDPQGTNDLTAALAAKGAMDPPAMVAHIGQKKYGRDNITALASAGSGRSNLAALPQGEPLRNTDTPTVGAVTAEPEPEQGHHSGPVMTRVQARARLLKMGILL